MIHDEFFCFMLSHYLIGIMYLIGIILAIPGRMWYQFQGQFGVQFNVHSDIFKNKTRKNTIF